MCTVTSKKVEFLKAAWVEEVVDALTSKHLSFFVLALNRARRAGVVGGLFALAEVFNFGGHRVVTHATDASWRGGGSPTPLG